MENNFRTTKKERWTKIIGQREYERKKKDRIEERERPQKQRDGE